MSAPPHGEVPHPDQWPPDLPSSEPLEIPATALDIERALLGVGLAYPHTLPELAALGVSGLTFVEPAHAMLWNIARTLQATGQPVSAVAVQVELERRGAARDGAMRALPLPPGLYALKLIESAPYDSQATWYAEQALHSQRKRQDAALAERIRAAAASPADDAHESVIALISDHLADDRAFTAPRPSTWQPVNLAELDIEAAVEPTLLARDDGTNLLYAGAVHSIVAEPGSAKSWLALWGARQELLAGNPVVMIDFEDRPGRVVRRLLDLQVPRDAINDLFRYIRPDQALTPDKRTLLDAACDGATLAILDGVTEAMTMHGLSLSDNEDIAKYLLLLPRRIADQGPAVVQIDHVVKDPEARGRYALGGVHKLAGIDGAQYKMIVHERFGRGKRGHAQILIDKDRHGSVEQHSVGASIADFVMDSTPEPDTIGIPVGPLRVYLNAPDATVIGDKGQFRPTVLMGRVSDYLSVVDGPSQTAIEGYVEGKAVNVRKAIRALVDEGYVRIESGSRGGSRYHLIMPFTDTPEETE